MRKIYLLLILSFFAFSYSANSQVIIAQQDFESSPASPVWSISAGSGNISTNTGAAHTPANQTIRNGIRSWQLSNGTSTLDLGSINVASYTGVQIIVRLSSTSVTTGNGADVGDYVRLFASVNGAAFPSNTAANADITVVGNSNARWSYNNTQNATTTAGTNLQVAGSSGTNLGTIYSTLVINIPNGSSTVALRLIALNNDANEFWNVDDVQLTGTLAATPDVNISTPGIGASSENQGATNVILQRYDLAVTTSTATLNGLSVITAGTYVATDLVNLKVRYSTDATLDISDATLSTKTTGLGAGTQVFSPFTTQGIAASNTGYVFLTADISGSATAGNTINIAPTPFADISFLTTVNKTGTDPVAAGGVKTFAALAPSIAISPASPIASSINQNSINNVLYSVQLDVTVNNATLSDVTFTTAGTYQVADLQANGFKLWINSANNLTGATQLGTGQAIVASGNTISFTGLSAAISSGTTRYLLVTADVAPTGTAGNTVSIAATPFTNIVFVSGTKTGTDPVAAGNDHTIAAVTPLITLTQTGPSASTVGNSSANVILYQWNAAVTANAATLNSVSFGTAGTYTATDLVANSFKLWYNSTNSFGTATQIGTSAIVASGSPFSFTGLTQQINAATTGFFWVTVDVAANPVSGNTINIAPTPFTSITFASGTLSGTDPMGAGGVKTLQLVPAAGEIVINQFNPGFSAAGDEFIELVNKTDKAFDLSALRISYQSSTGGAGGAGGVLAGTLQPHSYWLLSPNATITIGQTTGLARDGAITAGFAAAAGQLALQVVSTNATIDGLGYGTLTGGTLAEGTTPAGPTSNSGYKRNEGDDTNVNSADFSAVPVASIDLRNGTSRLALPAANIAAGSYSRLYVKGNSTIAGNVTLAERLVLLSGTMSLGASNITTAAALGGSSSAYVVTDGTGALTINSVGTTATVFPVGPSGSLYHPATITNTGTVDDFSVRVSSTVPPCLPAISSVNANWEITEAVAGGSICELSLDYAGASTGVAYTSSNADVVHCSGPVADYNNGSVTGTVATGYAFTSFSPFGITSDPVILPAGLITFSGYKQGNVNRLQWTTGSEQNNRGFEVLRSTDGVNYTVISFVNSQAANGNSSTDLTYSFVDNTPVGAKQYYRLRQVDLNGGSKLSNVVMIKGERPSTVVLDGLYPNPATSVVNVLVGAPGRDRVTVVVLDVTGRVMSQQLFAVEAGSNTIPVNVAGLTSGMYMVKLVCSSNCEAGTSRFIKQ